MNFLDMEIPAKDWPGPYEWYRTMWDYWQKIVLKGEILLKIEGSEAEGYSGTITSTADDYDRFQPIFSTRPKEGLHVPFKTPENCALHLENAWEEIINKEVNRNKIQK